MHSYTNAAWLSISGRKLTTACFRTHSLLTGWLYTTWELSIYISLYMTNSFGKYMLLQGAELYYRDTRPDAPLDIHASFSTFSTYVTLILLTENFWAIVALSLSMWFPTSGRNICLSEMFRKYSRLATLNQFMVLLHLISHNKLCSPGICNVIKPGSWHQGDHPCVKNTNTNAHTKYESFEWIQFVE